MSNEHDNESSGERHGLDRRNFLKLGLAGVGVAAAAATGVTINKRLEGLPHDEFPLPVNENYKRIDQRNQINTFVHSRVLSERHPERSRLFTERLKKEDPAGAQEFDFYKKMGGFMKGPYRDTPGYGHLERALAFGGFSSPNAQLGWGKAGMDVINGGLVSWEQRQLSKDRYEFDTPQQANLVIKSAAKVYGALRCGITRRDTRWDYDPLYDLEQERKLSWEDDFPFEPKSVIVILVDMSYEAIATAPSWITDATTGEGYGSAVKVAGQLAYFLRNLGYQSVASLNDLGVNPAYAAAAGLGEAARNGQLITPKYGPRVRIAKVYTDLEFVEYDKARTFGVASFCKHCKRCADACPSQAITHGDPSWGPTWSENPDDHWAGSKGIFKFHNDSQKCFKFWTDNDGGCASCICSCPYNKPDFWHHRLIDASNVISPGAVHTIMREMDILFGYGTVSDPDRVRRFWESGGKHMMDFTWFVLGILSISSGVAVWKLSRRYRLTWISLSGLIVGGSLILFSVAWGVGAVLEGVPRAASMGILLFGLPGIVLLTLTLRFITGKLERVLPGEATHPDEQSHKRSEPAATPVSPRGKMAGAGTIRRLVPYAAWLSLIIAFVVGAVSGGEDYESMVLSHFEGESIVKVNDSPLVFRLGEPGEGAGNWVLIQKGQGYGGPFVLGIRIMEDAKVHEVLPLDDKETPAFIKKVRDAGYKDQFTGKHVADDFIVGRDIDAVTGATITTMAAAEAIRKGAHLAAEQKFGLEPNWSKVPWQIGLKEILVLAVFVLAFIPGMTSGKLRKYIFLGVAVAVIGFYANASVSIGSIAALLMGFLPGVRDHLTWWILVVGTVVTILVLGRNVYCSGICPFHGIEFLLRKISGSKMNPSRVVMKRSKTVVNFLLWLSLMVIFLSRMPAAGAYEPFAMMFSLEGIGIQWYILPLALIGSFFMSNFWCRFFCPAGHAFTTLVKLRRRALSIVKGRKIAEGTQ